MFPSRAKSLFRTFTNNNIVRFLFTPVQATKPRNTVAQVAVKPVDPQNLLKAQIARASLNKNENKLAKSIADLKEYPGTLEPVVYLYLINGWKKIEKVDKMEEVLELAISKQIPLSEEIFVPFFYIYGTKNQFDKVNSLLERMKQLQVLPKGLTMNALSAVYARSGDFDTAAKIIQEMKNNGFQVESRAYRGLLNFYYHRKDVSKREENVKFALEAFEKMKAENIEITEGEYVVLFKIFEESRADPETIIKFFTSLPEGMQLHPRISSVAIQAYGRKGDKANVVELFKKYSKPVPIFVATAVLSSLRSAEHRELIRELFDQVLNSKLYELDDVTLISSIPHLRTDQLPTIFARFAKQKRGFNPPLLAVYLNQLRIRQDFSTVLRTLDHQLNNRKKQLSVGSIRLGIVASSNRSELKLWLGEEGVNVLENIRKSISKLDNDVLLSKEAEDQVKALLTIVEKRYKALDEFQTKLAKAE